MLIELNQEIMEGLSKTEKEIVVFINENEERLAELSIVDISFETFTSPSTVSRAIRKCGINGFNELRYRLTEKESDKNIQKGIQKNFCGGKGADRICGAGIHPETSAAGLQCGFLQ